MSQNRIVTVASLYMNPGLNCYSCNLRS